MDKKQIFQATVRVASEIKYEFKHGFQVGDVVKKYGHGGIKSESHGVNRNSLSQRSIHLNSLVP